MTLQAHRILSDCRVALEMLVDEEDGDRWRVTWVAAMTLVRSVGHVLKNEAEADQSLKSRISAIFREHMENKQQHAIYWEFIKAERDALLKESATQIYEADTTFLAVEDALGKGSLSEAFSLDGNLYRPVLKGSWAGEDARDVYLEAIEWWEREIARIEDAPSKA